jgi:hypothetical protein
MAVGHYANLISHETVGEYNIERDDIHLRLDHSMLARYCLDGVPAAAKVAFRSIGYSDEDFNSDILKRKPNGVWVLSFGADSWVCLYRHKATGCLIPFVNDIPGVTDPTKIPANERAKVISSPQKLSAIECLERDFEFAGLISEEQYKSNLQRVFNSMPSASVAFVMTFKDFYGPNNTKADSVVRLNRWTEEVQSQYGNVQLLPFMRFVHSNDDLLPDGHGKRMLYFRMFQYVRERASSGFRISNIREAPTMALQFNSQSSGTAETVFSPFPQSVTKLADLLEEQQQPRSE